LNYFANKIFKQYTNEKIFKTIESTIVKLLNWMKNNGQLLNSEKFQDKLLKNVQVWLEELWFKINISKDKVIKFFEKIINWEIMSIQKFASSITQSILTNKTKNCEAIKNIDNWLNPIEIKLNKIFNVLSDEEKKIFLGWINAVLKSKIRWFLMNQYLNDIEIKEMFKQTLWIKEEDLVWDIFHKYLKDIELLKKRNEQNYNELIWKFIEANENLDEILNVILDKNFSYIKNKNLRNFLLKLDKLWDKIDNSLTNNNNFVLEINAKLNNSDEIKKYFNWELNDFSLKNLQWLTILQSPKWWKKN